MYLKALEINGFKSFANKAVLNFLPPTNDRFSVTAIVGPNGSGKSNVSDAIRWVMGEQKMSTLRAKKGEDIIFSGSDAKGKLSLASVSLVLDNSDNRVDLPYDELTITRKLYRTGESEYLLNGNTIRLLDLQLLFAKAQFGHGSYSVVGQGTIDKMLLQTPADRKAFFDEAAGIKEFQIKRHQAALKLERTRENIEQATLLLQEVEPRMKSLSRQVKKLEERKDVEIALREMQETYFATLSSYNAQHMGLLQSALGEITTRFDASSKRLTKLQEELAALAKEASRQEMFDALQRSYQHILDSKNTLLRDRAVLQGRMQTEYSKAGKHNIGWLEQKIETLSQDAKSLEADVVHAKKEVTRFEDELSGARIKVQESSVACATLRSRLGSLEREAVEAKSEQTYFQYTGLRAVEAIMKEREHFGGIYGTVSQLGKVKEKYALAMDVAAGANLSSLVVKDDSVAGRCISFLRENRLGIATFLPLNKIQKRFVTQDIEGLLDEEGVHGLALDLITFEEKFIDIFGYVFGSTLVVENLDVARRIGIGKVRMVTLDGDVMERSGSMKGGFRNKKGEHGLSFSDASRAFGSGKSADALAQELDSIRATLEKEELNRESIVNQVHEYERSLQIARGELTILESRSSQVLSERAGLDQELSYSTMSREDYDSAMREVADERDALDARIEAVEKDVAEALAKIDQFNADEESKKQRVFFLQDEMQKEQHALNAVVNEKNEKQIELTKFETRQEDLGHEVYQELHITLEALLARSVASVDIASLEHVQSEIQKLKYKLSLIGGIDEEVVSEYEETKVRYEGLTSQLSDLEKAMEDLEKLAGELDEIMRKKRAKAFKEIKREFSRYFEILFEGGKADLIEIYGEEGSVVKGSGEDDEKTEREVALEAQQAQEEEQAAPKKKKKEVLIGIDVVANPPGKKITHLQSLSGGERTMTSIALVCAILHTNPSPFVVLDEVEAALDEANSIRFTKILQELSAQSQFILITHNRATMHSADALYGVTMGNDGISHLVGVKLADVKTE